MRTDGGGPALGVDTHVDVHHHAITEPYRERLRARAARHGAARVPEIPDWSEEASLRLMDASGVERALLSPAARGFGSGGTDEVVAFARAAHDELLGLRDRHPERFGVLAPLPLPSLDHAVAHVERALRRDGVEGIALLTQYAGRHVGEPAWDGLLDVLDRERALVHVHPTAPAGAPLGDHLGPHLVEYVFDTTRVAVLLARRRVFSRYPGIRWVFAHGGGTLPYVAGRLDDPPGTVDGGDGIEDLLRVSRFDSALLGGPALAALAVFAGPERVVFGSDAPFIHGDRAARLLEDLLAFKAQCLESHQEVDYDPAWR
ncbi:amidohydrolase family protein [Streptomyces radicis]|uniref:6-methylsalicylate decarboxylase n=1 Tax=Streptomyces radicis TaxID=1750517 RepID=A0A3A9VU31_9ACTN|nr:amidohydrolase family protein [Streptomyces radicis]RKN04250.1 amidohydrolase [Streptomyces radicis]RKN14768.1 amidohydrolase [Streptomyces radicis]